MTNSLKYGIISGIFASLLFFIIYFIKPALAFHTVFSMALLLIIVGVAIFKALSAERTKLNGQIKFGEAFICSLSTYAIYTLITVFSQYILLITSETAFEHLVAETKRATIYSMELVGTSEDVIMEQSEKITKEVIQQGMGFLQTLANCFVSILFPGALVAIIAAAIASRKKAQV